MELSQFDIAFKASNIVKGHALVDFVVEFTPILEMEDKIEPIEPPTWK